MRARHVQILILGLALTVASAAEAAEERRLSGVEWRQDLQQLVKAVREIHFKPFHIVSESDFEAAVVELDEAIPGLSDREIVVRMAEIVALLRDGHSRLHLPRQYPEFALEAEIGHGGTPPPAFETMKFAQLPVRFDLFEDGLFIIAASPEWKHLIGQQVLRIDESTVPEATERVSKTSFYENESRAKLFAPDRLALPDVLASVKIIESPEKIPLTLRAQGGEQEIVTLAPTQSASEDFVSGGAEAVPLWLSDRKAHRWYRLLPEEKALYVQVNRFEENPVTPYGDFVAETLEVARRAGADRYILDLRHNSGGVGAWTIPFVNGLGRSEFNRYGRLYVLISRTTYSAAQFLLNDLEELTWAIFVGEPGGAKPNHFGDPRRVVLANSGLTLRLSTIYWHSWLANDFREAMNPHIDAPLRSRDYFDGSDPGLHAALSYVTPDGIAEQIEEQFRLGKNQNALLLFQRYLTDPSIEDHQEAVPALLRMADDLVADGLEKPGYFVYLLSSAAYPDYEAAAEGLERLRQKMDSQ